MQGAERLEQLAKQFRDDHAGGAKPAPDQVTVREFLSWFGYEKRGKYIVSWIRNKMEKLELQTVPDFEFAYIGANISIEPAAGSLEGIASSEGLEDPTVRIGALEAANRKPKTVGPDESLSTATTLMLLHDYSQLPVMTTKHTVKGVISWQSIGARLALGRECKSVRNCMGSVNEIESTAPMFEAVGMISEHGYVLVRGQTREITGIVTASDVANQFEQLARPFLLVGEIEEYLRQLVHGKYTIEELRKASLSYEGRQPVSGSADLTLGDFRRLLENPECWCRLELRVDRVGFIQHLDSVIGIRNDVMHFAPDGLTDEDTWKLVCLAGFFRNLASMGAI